MSNAIEEFLKIKDRELRDEIKAKAKKEGDIGRRKMVAIRTSIIDKWFGKFDSRSMNRAWTRPTIDIRENPKSITLRIESHIDINRYEPKDKAGEWVARYGGDTDPREYVLRLQLDEGIIGLPERSDAYPEHNWENHYYHQQTPLFEVINEDERFQDLVEEIGDKIKQGVQ